MDRRCINEEYARIGRELIETEEILEDVKNSEATIVYLSSDYDKTSGEKKVLAQCEKVAEKYKWGIPADFTITVFEPNVQGFTDEQMRVLIFHELLHVGIGTGKEEMERYFVRKHDLEDFKEIIDRFGTDWATVKTDLVFEGGEDDGE